MFWLFLPHASGADPQQLAAVGLGELLAPHDDAPQFGTLAGPGPGNLPGAIVCWSPTPPVFQPDRQTWRPAVPDPVRQLPAGRYWWGCPSDAPLTPACLARKEVFAGIGAIRARGHEWRVPNVLDLPCRISIDPTSGKFAKAPQEEFLPWRTLAEESLQMALDALHGVSSPSFELSCERALRLLQLNYRLTRETAIASGVLTDEGAVMQALTLAAGDLEQLKEEYAAFEKKARPVASPA